MPITTSDIRTEYLPNRRVEQKFKYFSNLQKPFQDSRHQKGDITLVSHQETKIIMRHRVKFSCSGDAAPRICPSMVQILTSKPKCSVKPRNQYQNPGFGQISFRVPYQLYRHFFNKSKSERHSQKSYITEECKQIYTRKLHISWPSWIIQSIHKRMVRFQKLTRNLFLTLHGHDTHRQEQQLSKFLMRYQQFVSHAYCGAAGPVFKMVSQQEKAFCVLRFEVSKSVITVQREFRAGFRKDAPARCNILLCKPCTIRISLDQHTQTRYS